MNVQALDELLETLHILTNLGGRIPAHQPCDGGADFASRRAVLEANADPRSAGDLVEVH
jgi:hypothetical protein